MTSQISFLKLSKEYRKHHMIEFLLAIFAVFVHVLWFVIALQNILENYGDDHKREDIIFKILEGMGSTSLFAVLSCMLGALMAFMAFRYLHSRQKIDFYHSLPIKRKDMFHIIVASNLVFMLLPMLVGILLETAICGAAGYLTLAVFQSLCRAFLVCLTAYGIGFAAQALAMILTGNLVVGVMGGWVFALYAPFLLYSVVTMYASTFFDTYAEKTDASLLFPFSPLTLSFRLGDFSGTYYKISPFYLLVTLVWIAALLILCRYLYQIRKSEMAGKAMAFPRMKTALKIIMVVPAALFAGLVLYEMTLAHSRIWLLAGIFLGAVLFHGLVESIYQLDVRGLWSHRKQMLVTVALSFALAMVFWLDLSGYDSYLPKMGSIKSMNIEDSSVCMESEHWGKPAAGLEGQEMEAAYNLISDIVSDKPWKDSGQAFHNITVTYTLGHGRKAVRRYNIPVEKYMDQLDWLYQCRDFKEDNCSVLTADSRKISEISVSVFNPDIPYEMMYENVEKKDREEFRKIYSEELAELKYSEVMKEIPVGSLEVFYYSGLDDPGNGAEESNLSATMGITHYIYPSFSKTIEWLTKKGYVDKIQREGQYKIRQITLYRNDGENQMNQVTCTVKDPALIEEVKSKLVPADLVQGGSLLDLDPNVTIDVEYVSGRDVWTVGMQADSETVKKLENAAEK